MNKLNTEIKKCGGRYVMGMECVSKHPSPLILLRDTLFLYWSILPLLTNPSLCLIQYV